jgi:hypothetical protein
MSSSSALCQIASSLEKHRFSLLIATYTLITAGAFFRISRQPYNARVKMEQYETVFKSTTLGAVLAGIGMGGFKRRSEQNRA